MRVRIGTGQEDSAAYPIVAGPLFAWTWNAKVWGFEKQPVSP